jgi:hypothetical protein
MFTYIFGGAIAGNVHNYLPTIIPGILAMTVLTTSLVTGVQIREDMDKGVFNRFRSMPMSRIAPLAGQLIADIIRYSIATVLTLVMGYILGWRPGGGFGYLAIGASTNGCRRLVHQLDLCLYWHDCPDCRQRSRNCLLVSLSAYLLKQCVHTGQYFTGLAPSFR